MAIEIGALIETQNMTPEPYVDPVPAVIDPFEDINTQLESAGVDVRVDSLDDVAAARAYLRRRQEDELLTAFESKFNLT